MSVIRWLVVQEVCLRFKFASHFESHLAQPHPFYIRMRTTISDEHSIVTMLRSTRIILSTYRIAGNIDGNYIWRIARKSKLADLNLAVFASPPTRLHDDVTLLRVNKNWRILIWGSARKPPIRQI